MKTFTTIFMILIILIPLSYANTSSLNSRDPAFQCENKILYQSGQLEEISDVETTDSVFQNGVAQNLNSFFTANQGQVGCTDVQFYIQGHGIWFTSSGVVFELVEPPEEKRSPYDKFEMYLRTPEDL